jgi:hypothetical protein
MVMRNLMQMLQQRLKPTARHRPTQIGGMDSMYMMDMECITVRRMELEHMSMMTTLVMKKGWMKL